MRVIAGRLGGQALKAPPGDTTRPTGAKVKEALYSILGDVSGLRVLDLYAGSGALGIEALSRGAAFAVFVEAARPALGSLRANLAKLGLLAESASVPLRVEIATPSLRRYAPFDLVLCDPPWKKLDAARRELENLVTSGLLAPGARLVLEHSAKDAALPAGRTSPLRALDERSWGDTAVTFLEPADVPAPNNQAEQPGRATRRRPGQRPAR